MRTLTLRSCPPIDIDDVALELDVVVTQSEDESEPDGELCPLGQLMHDVRSLRSYCPAGQSVQLDRDDVSCLPAAQEMQLV